MRRVVFVLAFCIAIAIASPAQTLTTLVNFDGNNGNTPLGTLVQGSDGNFYGTTNGGYTSSGTVFKITPEGTLTTLHTFNFTDGNGPRGALVEGKDGYFYGTTLNGGANNAGVVFKISSEGDFAILYNFNYAEGGDPWAGLVQGTDGNFYGTSSGGLNGVGTVFKITPTGLLTILHNFNGDDGAYPEAGLVQATDGNFYGTTYAGGPGSNGTVFKMTPTGTLTTLHGFSYLDGYYPEAGLVQGTDGNFYGTTIYGGVSNSGTVFKITPAGTLTTLYSFCAQDFCADGTVPEAGLVEATDGNFYGTTAYGGANQSCSGGGCGTVFQITPAGKLTTLYSFNGSDGSQPEAGLVQATDGSFYGTTSQGGSGNNCYGYDGCGTVFHLLAYAALSVSKSGMGTITSGDGHIYCGNTCVYTYLGGAQVGLTAIPSPGYTFSSWTGCDNVNGDLCSVTIDSAKSVAATFDVANVNLVSLVFNPTSVKGGNISIATLTLGAPAPPGGVGVAMDSDHPLVVHPPSLVIVPGGRTSFSFAVRTSAVRMTTVANVTASAGASQTSGTLTVTTGYGSSASLR